MHQEAVADLARHLGHVLADAGQQDLRVAVGVGARIEERRHERVRVELAPEVELFAGLPRLPDGPDGQDHLAHARRRVRPRHGEALRDVRLDLAAHPQHEPPLGQQLEVVGHDGQGHRVAGEGHGDAGAELELLGGRRADGNGEERVVAGLGRPHPVVPARPPPWPPARRRLSGRTRCRRRSSSAESLLCPRSRTANHGRRPDGVTYCSSPRKNRSSSAAISSPEGTASTPIAFPSEASMLSSSLRTMAWCSALSAMSWSTWRRELSAGAAQRRRVQGEPGHGGQALDQRRAGLGERHARHVVGHPGPQADGGGPVGAEGHLERGQDARRHLELALDDPDLLNQVGRPGRRGGRQLHRARVRRRRRERSQSDHQAHPPGAGQADHGVGEGAPVEVGLGPDQEEHVRPDSSVPWRTTQRGQVSSVVTPLTMWATGRRARWSRKCSPLNVTRGSVWLWPSSAAMAVVAPRPASTQPSSDNHQHGLVEDGLVVDLEDLGQSVGAHRTDSSDSAAISKSRPIWAGKLVDAALVARARAGHVAGVDALEDAGQLPVAEGGVVADLGEVEIRDRPRSVPGPRPSWRTPAPSWGRARAPPWSRSGRPSRPSAARRRRADRRACRSPSRGWPAPTRRRPARRCPCGSPRARSRSAAAWGCAGPARRSPARPARRDRRPRPASGRTAQRQRLSCRSM